MNKRESKIELTIPRVAQTQNRAFLAPLVTKYWAILLYTYGAALLTKETYRKIKIKLEYFGEKNKNLFEVNVKIGEVCMGAQATDNISEKRKSDKVQQKEPNKTEAKARKIDKRKSVELNLASSVHCTSDRWWYFNN